MNLYSKPMMHSFTKLETEGFAININRNEHVSRGFLLCELSDKLQTVLLCELSDKLQTVQWSI